MINVDYNCIHNARSRWQTTVVIINVICNISSWCIVPSNTNIYPDPCRTSPFWHYQCIIITFDLLFQYESNEVGSCDSSIKKRNSSLLFDNKKCAAGFARVRVEGDQQLIAANMGLTLRGNGKASALVQQCFINHESQTWLSSGGIMKVLQGSHVDSVDIRGPARKIGGGIRDWVPALICSDPPLEMAQFLERKRYSIWPKRETLERMQHLPLVLVLTGHKSSPLHHLEYRYSWSIPEMLLAWDMPVWIKQGYWAFKYVLNHQLESARLASHETNGCESLQEGHVDGRSMCGSYHWKTVLLWELEQPGTWECQCPYRLFHRLLWRLSSHLGEDTHPCILPHYFLSQCNLFECVSDEDLQLTLQCVRYIQKHPGEVIPGAVFFTEEVLGPSVERYDFESLLKTLITSGVLTASNEQRAFSENMLNLVEEHRQGKYKLQKLDDERSFYSWISNRIELHNILEIYRRLARSSV